MTIAVATAICTHTMACRNLVADVVVRVPKWATDVDRKSRVLPRRKGAGNNPGDQASAEMPSTTRACRASPGRASERRCRPPEKVASPQIATTIPKHPPAQASTTHLDHLRAHNPRGRRPKAARSASSRDGATPRARSSPATLAAAISSTQATAANSTSSDRSTPPTTLSRSDTTVTLQPRLVDRITVLEAPGDRLQELARAVDGRARPQAPHDSEKMRRSGLIPPAVGKRRPEAVVARVGNANARGMTPTTTVGTSSTTRVRPTMPGSAPNSSRHKTLAQDDDCRVGPGLFR